VATRDAQAGLWLLIGCIAVGVALFSEKRKNQNELQRMRMRIGQLNALVAEKKRIADS